MLTLTDKAVSGTSCHKIELIIDGYFFLSVLGSIPTDKNLIKLGSMRERKKVILFSSRSFIPPALPIMADTDRNSASESLRKEEVDLEKVTPPPE